MPHSYTHLYIHFVWATWDRAPIITPALEAPLYACITRECRDLKCVVIALGGTEDHVHVLARLLSDGVACGAREGHEGLFIAFRNSRSGPWP